MSKGNKEITKRLIALALSATGLVSLVGCGNNQKEKVQVPTNINQITQEDDLTYFDTLKRSERKKITEIAAGLHMPKKYLKNDEIVSELLDVVLKDRKYASTVDFISSPGTPEFYYTSDGKFVFIKGEDQFWLRKTNDNNMVIKSIKVDSNAQTIISSEYTYCNDNGETIQNDSSVNSWGMIAPSVESKITYGISKSFGNAKSEFYFFDYIDNQLTFSSENNFLRLFSDNGAYTSSYIMNISDEEKQEVMSNFNNHNHEALQALANKLFENYKDDELFYEGYCCRLPFQTGEEDTAVYVSRSGLGNGEYANSVSLYDGVFDLTDASIKVQDITDEQYNTLRDYMERKDENIIAYVEQIASEQDTSETAKNGEKAKVYTKQLPAYNNQ